MIRADDGTSVIQFAIWPLFRVKGSNPMRVLVPLDGSPLAETALGPATQLLGAATTPGTLILARVVEASIGTAAFVLAYDQAINAAVENANDYLRDLAARPELAGLIVERHTVVATNTVGALITQEAERRQAELIVMSSHGRGGLALVALGSVATQVARASAVPVLVVRAADTFFGPRLPTEPFDVLVPLDGSVFAEAALPQAMTMAQAFQGAVRLLMVIPPAVPGDIQPPHATTADEAAAYLRGVARRLESSGIPITTQVAIGEPGETIPALAHKPNVACDLIVMATHGRSGLRCLLVGSVTEAVMRQTRKPLLIVPAALARISA